MVPEHRKMMIVLEHGEIWVALKREPEVPELLQLVWTPALCIPDTSDRHVYFPLQVI